MTVNTQNVDHYINSTATLRAWGAAWAAALDAVGFTRSADTGQVDWSTVNWPGTGVLIGYEVRRFTDPLQATKPIFCKISYYDNTGGVLGITLQFGTGSNGAGTLTGNLWSWGSSANGFGFVRPAASKVLPIKASGVMTAAEARVAVCAGADDDFDLNDDAFVLAIQRTVDPDGTPNGDGFFALAVTAQNEDNSNENFYDFTSGVWRGDANTYWTHANGNSPPLAVAPPSVGVLGGISYPVPWPATGHVKTENPLPDWLIYHEVARPLPLETFSISRLGASRTYLCTGAIVKVAKNDAVSYDWRLAMLWE